MPKKNPLSLQIDLSKFEKATDEEKQQADVMSRSTTFFRDGMRKLMRNPLAVASIVVLALIMRMNRSIWKRRERSSFLTSWEPIR